MLGKYDVYLGKPEKGAELQIGVAVIPEELGREGQEVSAPTGALGQARFSRDG